MCMMYIRNLWLSLQTNDLSYSQCPKTYMRYLGDKGAYTLSPVAWVHYNNMKVLLLLRRVVWFVSRLDQSVLSHPVLTIDLGIWMWRMNIRDGRLICFYVILLIRLSKVHKRVESYHLLQTAPKIYMWICLWWYLSVCPMGWIIGMSIIRCDRAEMKPPIVVFDQNWIVLWCLCIEGGWTSLRIWCTLL